MLFIVIDNTSDIVDNPPDFFADLRLACAELFRRYAYAAYNNRPLMELRMSALRSAGGRYQPAGTWFIAGSELEEAVSELSATELSGICATTQRGCKPYGWSLDRLVFSQG
jgi:hypothetical protein